MKRTLKAFYLFRDLSPWIWHHFYVILCSPSSFITMCPGADTPNNSVVSEQVAPSGTFSYFLHASPVRCIFHCSFVTWASMERICNLLNGAKIKLTDCTTVLWTPVLVRRGGCDCTICGQACVCVKETWQSCWETHCLVLSEGKASCSMSVLLLETVLFILGCKTTFSLSIVDFTVN